MSRNYTKHAARNDINEGKSWPWRHKQPVPQTNLIIITRPQAQPAFNLPATSSGVISGTGTLTSTPIAVTGNRYAGNRRIVRPQYVGNQRRRKPIRRPWNRHQYAFGREQAEQEQIDIHETDVKTVVPTQQQNNGVNAKLDVGELGKSVESLNLKLNKRRKTKQKRLKAKQPQTAIILEPIVTTKPTMTLYKANVTNKTNKMPTYVDIAWLTTKQDNHMGMGMGMRRRRLW